MKQEAREGNSIGGWIIAMLISIVFIAFVADTMCGGYERPKRQSDLSNIKQIGVAHSMYMEYYDGHGPPPNNWMDALAPILKNDMILVSPDKWDAEGEYGNAYLRELGTIRLSDVLNPESVPTIFNSSDLRRNANGGLELLPDPPRWDGEVNNIVFLDSHAKGYRTTPKFKIELP